jgi:hypothetical protein
VVMVALYKVDIQKVEVVAYTIRSHYHREQHMFH